MDNHRKVKWGTTALLFVYAVSLVWLWNRTGFPDSLGVQTGDGRMSVLENWYYSYLLLQRHQVLDVVTFIYMWAFIGFFGWLAYKFRKAKSDAE